MNDDAGAKEIPAAAPTGRGVHLALLELKTAALARRVDALRRDALLFLVIGLVALPLALHHVQALARQGAVLPVSVALALLAVGIPAWRRERREARAEEQRRRSIYLSIRPDVFGP
ncbi:MAG TPA: hypothetical protein PKE36_09070 [Chiayiivirga sp.]|nr:hypothetical protein [Xanthomonadaceae bacterium]HMN35541.1 hypothetical protein [Chiayiivirga sp.]